MFRECRKVQSGAYDAYLKLSTGYNLSSINRTFYNCGSDTSTGIEDLKKIPMEWGGYNGAPTLTCEYATGTAPYTTSSDYIKTQVSESPNIWTIMSKGTSISGMFSNDTNLIRVIEADTSKCTSLFNTFYHATNLVSVCELDTSKVYDFSWAFIGCENLTSMPALDVSSATDAFVMLAGCSKLEGIATTMYSRLAARGTYISRHANALSGCGIDTEGGYEALTNIPQEWGGVAPCQTATIGGRKYRVVKIGNQLWMAENLDWKYPGISIGSSSSSYTTKYANYAYDDESTYGVNGKKYGLLYNHAAAESISTDDGWHLPTKEEWETLFSNISSSMSTVTEMLRLYGDNYCSMNSNWYDHTGLRLLPSGMGNYDNPKRYYSVQNGMTNTSGTGYYWTATKYPSNPNYQAYYFQCGWDSSSTRFDTNYGRNNHMSVRLVKNV
jgi:uncharacterized protein (TIGR02145 family)